MSGVALCDRLAACGYLKMADEVRPSWARTAHGSIYPAWMSRVLSGAVPSPNECPKCPPGSDKEKGHVGPHRSWAVWKEQQEKAAVAAAAAAEQETTESDESEESDEDSSEEGEGGEDTEEEEEDEEDEEDEEEMEDSRGWEECKLCPPGSGKKRGHFGPHKKYVVVAVPKAATSRGPGGAARGGAASTTTAKKALQWCPKCVRGAGKLRGHGGPHKINPPKELYHQLSSPPRQPPTCPLCVKGSGKLLGHGGPHKINPPKVFPLGPSRRPPPCPLCVKGSGKLAGHSGAHLQYRGGYLVGNKGAR